jgi:RNA polymerase sigma-70 factor (ECF subfamily)
LASEPAFITMLARRCVIERLRDRVPRPPRQPMPDSLGASEQASPVERCPEALAASAVLASMDPRQRRAVSLAIGQAMTYAEVAAHADMTTSSAKSLLRRALVAVRKRVQARQGDTP